MPGGNEAWDEAIASCPPTVLIYDTLEIQHSTFDQPARIVANVGDDVVLGIEAGATLNPGEMVTFLACPLECPFPEQREGQPLTAQVRIDNVNRELVPKIRGALLTREYLKIIWRQYVSTDLTTPAYGPVEFLLKDVKMVGSSLTGSAMVGMLLNKRFPRRDKNYNYIQFPSLLPG